MPQIPQQEPQGLTLAGGAAAGWPLTCALFTREGQVVIAGHVVPLSLLVPDHHHAVLSADEEVVRLVGAPVLKLLGEGGGLAGVRLRPELGLTPAFFSVPDEPMPLLHRASRGEPHRLPRLDSTGR